MDTLDPEWPITVMLAETRPGDYQGALALCGPLGGGRLETDYIGNVRVLFDFFFPGVIPATSSTSRRWNSRSRARSCRRSSPPSSPRRTRPVALAAVDQIDLPYRTLSELVCSIVRPLGYNIRGTNDILARTGGQSPFGNLTTWYTGLGLYDATVNAGVGRFASKDAAIRYMNDYYRPTGSLTAPLLTLHTTMDPDVPFFHEAALAKIVSTAGRRSGSRNGP